MSLVLLGDFLHQLAVCSEKAACIARHIRFMQADFNSIIQEKQLDENHQHLDADYKTLADVIIQEVIKRDLRAQYPSLGDRIYGEEDGFLRCRTTKEKILINVTGSDAETLNLLKRLFNDKSTESIQGLADLVSTSYSITLSERCTQSFAKLPSDLSIDLSSIGIWIDPVDGTQQYISGTDGLVDPNTGITIDGLPAALILIGCFDVHHGNAVVGLINRAFHHKVNAQHWNSLIYWGTALPNAKFNNMDDVHPAGPACGQQVLLHGSVNHQAFDDMLKNWLKLEVAACGNKLLSIALRQANVYLLTKSAAFNWDLCAAHAILLSVGGQILDLHRLLGHVEQNQSLENLDCAPFQILYNNNNSVQPSHFRPADYACPPFLAYHNQHDLIDILQSILVNKIHFE